MIVTGHGMNVLTSVARRGVSQACTCLNHDGPHQVSDGIVTRDTKELFCVLHRFSAPALSQVMVRTADPRSYGGVICADSDREGPHKNRLSNSHRSLVVLEA